MTGIPGKTGIVYTLDRETGEFLWARPTVMQNVVKNIDGATGKVEVDPERVFTHKGHDVDGVPRHERRQELAGRRVQPAHERDVHADAEHVHERHDPERRARSEARLRLLDASTSRRPAPSNIGVVWAISAEKGTTLWKHEQRVGVMSLAATGGGLVFGGDVAGNFRAFDDTTGEVLWETNFGAPVSGFPVSFAVDGKQYVAVTTGPSLVAAASRRVTPELTGETRRGARSYVFALP